MMTTLENKCREALNNSHRAINKLGDEKRLDKQENQFGEMALKADVEAEEAVIETFKGLPIRLISEEHGAFNLHKNPEYLAILDGLDGSRPFKEGKGRYGTMLGIFNGLNPSYNDFICSGILEHTTNSLYFANRGGAYKNNQPIGVSGNTELDKNRQIYVDEYFDINIETFTNKLQGFNTACLGASCVYYMDLAEGNADLVLECTRKGNLEIAVAYPLITQAGGAFVTLDGQSIGDKKYFEFGQNEKIPVIAASSKKLADNLIDYIKP